MFTADLCHQIENHFCCIEGTAYTFKVHSAAMLPGAPRRAVLHIGASSRNEIGPAAITATMRVTAAVDDLHRVPYLLDSALRHWLFAEMVAAPVIH